MNSNSIQTWQITETPSIIHLFRSCFPPLHRSWQGIFLRQADHVLLSGLARLTVRATGRSFAVTTKAIARG